MRSVSRSCASDSDVLFSYHVFFSTYRKASEDDQMRIIIAGFRAMNAGSGGDWCSFELMKLTINEGGYDE